jgi:hypothetical protein
LANEEFIVEQWGKYVWYSRQSKHIGIGKVKSGISDMTPRNLIGPRLRRLRTKKGMSQQMLAVLLQRHGWDASRGMVARIEGQVRWVSDFELLFLSEALSVSVEWFLAEPNNLALARKLVVDLQRADI